MKSTSERGKESGLKTDLYAKCPDCGWMGGEFSNQSAADRYHFRYAQTHDSNCCRQAEKAETDEGLLGDALKALELLLTGADDVLDHFSADGIVDDLTQAVDGLRDDVKQARAVLARGRK